MVDELQKIPEIEQIVVFADAGETGTGRAAKISEKTEVYRVWTPRNPLSLLFLPVRILLLNPDVVHFNVHIAIFGRSRIANFLGLSLPLVCRMFGFKTLTTLHNLVEKVDLRKAGFRDSIPNRFGVFIITKLLTHCSYLTVTMKSYVKLLRERYRCRKIVWIPHGTWNVDPGTKISHNPQTILCLGHLGPSKDLSLMLEAFEIINEKKNAVSRRVKLVIAGGSHPDHPNFLAVHKLNCNQSNIQFAEYLPESEFSEFFRTVDVIVLPYRTCTGTSGVAHLASSYGMPIVATDLPEFRELVSEGCKIILSEHRPVALAEKIESVLDSPALMLELREQNLIFARGRTWEKIAHLFYRLYQQVVTDCA